MTYVRQPAATVEALLADCHPHLTTLRRSAMFAMSRGGKELFHTNFLAFVLETDVESLDEVDRPAVAQVRQALLLRLFGSPAPEKVVAWREARRLDLVLAAYPEADPMGRPRLNGRAALDGKPKRSAKESTQTPVELGASLVVVEAKLKALPDAEQLRRYDRVLHAGLALALDPEVVLAREPDLKIWGRLAVNTCEAGSEHSRLRAYPPKRANEAADDVATQRRCFATGYARVRRLLLAPADPAGAAAEADWDFLPWAEVLNDFDASPHRSHGAVEAMLRDYASSTRALLAVLQEVTDFVAHGLIPIFKNLALRDVAAIPAGFQSLRIHDVVGKHAFSVLLAALTKSLKGQGIPSSFGEWQRHTDVFLTRGTPGFWIEYRLCVSTGREARQFSIGVQVQGTSYRHYVSASHASKAKAEQSLRSLTSQVCGPTSTGTSWWALGPAADLSLKKFDDEGFLYVSVDAASWTFEQLERKVVDSVALAAAKLGDAGFDGAARELLQSRRGAH